MEEHEESLEETVKETVKEIERRKSSMTTEELEKMRKKGEALTRVYQLLDVAYGEGNYGIVSEVDVGIAMLKDYISPTPQ